MTLPSMMPASCAFWSLLPACAMALPASTALPSRGSSTRPRPSDSKTTAMSKPAPPKPPSSSPNRAPITPSSANWPHMSGEKPRLEAAMRLRTSKPYCWATKRSRVSASMRRSSVCSKFISASQSQDHLGDDVFLDLVGAAEDRQLAVVEVLRRCGVREGGADLGTVVVRLQRGLLERARVDAHGTARQR